MSRRSARTHGRVTRTLAGAFSPPQRARATAARASPSPAAALPRAFRSIFADVPPPPPPPLLRLRVLAQVIATVTYQSLFTLYEKVAGMSGTATQESAEFESVYGTPVVQVKGSARRGACADAHRCCAPSAMPSPSILI